MAQRVRSFLTGATGLIGRHLVERLARRGEDLILLVRPDRAARHAARIADATALAARHGGSVTIVRGDIALEGLGLGDAERSTIDIANLDHVFHAAALYDLAADPVALETVNVGGTRNLLALLTSHNFDGVLHHLSSIAVAGHYRGRFTEEMLEKKQAFPTEYHRTKHDSERLVRAEARVRHRIYRPGAVVGHSKTGEMDRIDGAYYLFRAIQAMRTTLPRWVTLPRLELARIEMVPVDFVADAIDAIAHREGLDGKCFHVADPSPPKFRDTFNLIADAADAPRMGRTHLSKLADLIPGGKNVIGQLGMVRFFRKEILEDLGIPPIVHEVMSAEVELDTTNLESALAGSGLRCPRQEEYVEVLWDYYRRHLDPSVHPEAVRRRALSGKVVLVTGASSGIGEALTRHLAELGASVAIVARRSEELERVAASIGNGNISCHTADLSDLATCDRVVADVIARHGRVDVLVNNAGRSIRRPLAESLERFHDLERVMQINYFAPARLIRAVLPSMRAQGGGTIVNVLSAGAVFPAPRFGAYTASKAALGQLGDTLAAEHLHEGIRVSNVYLPWVRTPMMDATGKYEETKAMTPDEAARWIIDGIAHRRAHVRSTEVRRRFVGMRIAPTTITRILNVLYRVYSDDPDAHPELALDRMIVKRFFRGAPM